MRPPLSPLLALLLAACSPAAPPPAAPAGPAAPSEPLPADAAAYRVVSDEVADDGARVTLKVAVAGDASRKAVDRLLPYLYRWVVGRAAYEPRALVVLVYGDAARAAQPDGWLARLEKPEGALGPNLENRIEPPFAEQVATALELAPGSEAARSMKLELDEAARAVTVELRYLEPGSDQELASLKLADAAMAFTDVAQRLFRNVTRLSALGFRGRHKGVEVLRVDLTAEQYEKLHVPEIEETLAASSGKVYSALYVGRGSEAKLARERLELRTREYRRLFSRMPRDKVKLSPALR